MALRSVYPQLSRPPHARDRRAHDERVHSTSADPSVIRLRKQLLADGYTDDVISGRRRSGAWVALHRGAYCPVASLQPLDEVQQLVMRTSAVAAKSPQLVVSHTSAAALHGLPLWGITLANVHLTRQGAGGNRKGPGRIVHSGRLAPTQIVDRLGISVTTVGRTLADLARLVPAETAVIAADFALHEGLVTPEELRAELDDARHGAGTFGMRRALAFADGRSESVGESRTRLALHDAGLPAPELQVSIYAPDGRLLGRSDFGYPELALLLEFDGASKYDAHRRPGESAADVVRREKRREDAIRELGWLIIRIVWGDLADLAALAWRVQQARERGRRVVELGGVRGRWSSPPPIKVS